MSDANLPASLWIAYWRFMRRYHRFETLGLETLLKPRPCLIVGYHARGFAVDMCMLSVDLYDELQYLPHAIFHRGIERLPVLGSMMKALGGVSGDDAVLRRATEAGEHIVVMPGGAREGLRDFRHRYRVDWGRRTGYLKLAARLEIPIVPVAASGVDDIHFPLNNGNEWSRKLGMPGQLPAWLAFGLTGVWPLTLPFPVKILQLVGERIELGLSEEDLEDEDVLLEAHRLVSGEVQRLLDRARAEQRRRTR